MLKLKITISLAYVFYSGYAMVGNTWSSVSNGEHELVSAKRVLHDGTKYFFPGTSKLRFSS